MTTLFVMNYYDNDVTKKYKTKTKILTIKQM